MKKHTIFITLLTLVATIFLVGIPLVTADQNYAKVPTPNHSETKAICTLDNLCEDYELFCEDNKLVELKATGFAVKFSPAWQDPRSDEQKKVECKN